MTEKSKLTNPKDSFGSAKLPMHLIPGTAKAWMAMAFLEGALKYGKYNWRIAGVRTSIYMDAMERHYEKFKNGEWSDAKTKVPHLASMMACQAIILDAHDVGMLNDDRPPMADTSELIDNMEGHVAELKELFKDFSPHQCTIEDSPCPPESQPTPTTKSTTELPRPRSSEQRVIRPDGKPRQMELFPKETERKSITKLHSVMGEATQRAIDELLVARPTAAIRVTVETALSDTDWGLERVEIGTPVSEECWCANCNTAGFALSHMIVCPDCGDKRCARAHDCRLFCQNPPVEPGYKDPFG